jgi:hypothetical protein
MKQFVAMTDEVLYRSDALPGPLVPYQCGVFCWHQLRDEILASGALPSEPSRAVDERGAISA